VLCEYLASHGYVVVNSGYQSEGAVFLNVDWDLDRSFRDMDFLVRIMQQQPNVDASRVGAAGHSYGAQAVICWKAQPNSVVDAVVSLDSTVENVPPDDVGFGKLWERLACSRNFSVPLLLFASSQNRPHFSNWDRLRYAARFEATVEHLEHDDYITHGAISGDLLPGRRFLPEKQRLVRTSYDLVCRHTLRFFDAHLKGDAEAQAFLQDSADGCGSRLGPLTLRYREPAAVAPSARQLIQHVVEQGPEEALGVVARFESELDERSFYDMAYGLQDWGNRQEILALLTLCAQVAPASWTVFQELCRDLARSGDRQGAVAAYCQALELTAPDQEVSSETKERLKNQLLQTVGRGKTGHLSFP
jgi:dienelactone hydrolase